MATGAMDAAVTMAVSAFSQQSIMCHAMAHLSSSSKMPWLAGIDQEDDQRLRRDFGRGQLENNSTKKAGYIMQPASRFLVLS